MASGDGSFKEKLALLVFAAVLTLLTSAAVGYVNYQLGMQRLAHERKLEAFRDYSMAFNTFLQDMERAIEATDEQGMVLEKWPVNNQVQIAALTRDFADLQNSTLAAAGAINAQVFIVNGAFSEQLALIDQDELQLGVNLALAPPSASGSFLELNRASARILRGKVATWRKRFTDDMQSLSKQITQ